MGKEIGSCFDMSPLQDIDFDRRIDMARYGVYGNDSVFLSSGRAAISLSLDAAQLSDPQIKKCAFLPPYTCHTVLEPFIQRGYQIFAYPIKGDLSVNGSEFAQAAETVDPGIVLIHRYFGFDTFPEIDSIIERCRKRGTVFIEDRTQCLYSNFCTSKSDYIVGSFRKWGPLPDGGFCTRREGIWGQKPREWDRALEKAKTEASYLKYRYLFEGEGEKKEFMQMFADAEEILNAEVAYYCMSPTAKGIQESMDIDYLKGRRQNNYKKLYETLKLIDAVDILTPEPNEDAVPLYLAICCEQRDELQGCLRERDIYAPIIWPRPSILPPICSEAEMIYRNVLCIPVDQRYGEDDMEKIGICVRDFADERKGA